MVFDKVPNSLRRNKCRAYCQPQCMKILMFGELFAEASLKSGEIRNK